MYVKITNGNVDTFPYNVGQLRRDNPNTSFPKQIPNSILESYGIYPVTYAEIPSVDDKTQKINQAETPTLVDGVWTITCTIENKTSEEISAWNDIIAVNNRSKRDGYLIDSDWTQVADAPVDASTWATYRQALRDITTHANWPHLNEDDWPTKP